MSFFKKSKTQRCETAITKTGKKSRDIAKERQNSQKTSQIYFNRLAQITMSQIWCTKAPRSTIVISTVMIQLDLNAFITSLLQQHLRNVKINDKYKKPTNHRQVITITF